MRRRSLSSIVLLFTLPLCSTAAIVACFSSGGEGGLGSTPGTPNGTNSSSSGSSSGSGASDGGGAVDASDAPSDTLDGSVGVTIVDSVTLPGVPQAMVFNANTNLLYVSVSAGSTLGTSGGIAVVDAVGDTVKATIPPVSYDGGTAAPFTVMAYDGFANMLYAGFSYASTPLIYVFNGSTNTMAASFNLTTLPGTDSTAHVDGLAVDTVGHHLYADVRVSSSGYHSIVVFDTTLGLTLLNTMDATDMSEGTKLAGPRPQGSSLAIDTQNDVLLACGGTLTADGGNPPQDNAGFFLYTGVDSFDTVVNSRRGTQSQLRGQSLGCQAAPNFAATASVSPARVVAIGQNAWDLPTGFTPTGFQMSTALGYEQVLVFGVDSDGGPLSAWTPICGGQLLASPQMLYVDAGPAVDSGSDAAPDVQLGGYLFGLPTMGASYGALQTMWVTAPPNAYLPGSGALPQQQIIYKVQVQLGASFVLSTDC